MGYDSINYTKIHTLVYIDGLVQEICNSSALAMELCLSCINLWIYMWHKEERLYYDVYLLQNQWLTVMGPN